MVSPKFPVNYIGDAHARLCNLAKSILEKRGFTVEQEKLIRLVDGPQQRYKIDVYGEKDGEILMYECGNCSQTKLGWLRQHVGKVVHMPYLDQWCSWGWYNWRKGLTEEDLYNLTKRLSERTW